MMRTKNILLFLLMLCTYYYACAQENLYTENLYIKKNCLREEDNKIHIDLLFNLDSINISPRKVLTLIPVLKNDSNQMLLPEIWFNGKNRQKVYERRLLLNSELDIYKGAYIILDSKNSHKIVEYKITVPFEPWMRNAHLFIQQDKCGCSDKRSLLEENDLGHILFKPNERYTIQPFVTFITPEAETVKDRNEIGEAFLDFVVGQYKILPGFRNNPQELAKVNKTISDALADKNIVINGITFTGKASPEASYTYNMKLSQNRAKALLDYANTRYKLKKEWLHAKSIGEDWIAFQKIVEVSDIENRDEVLQIIKSNESPDIKEQKLKTLYGDNTYKWLNKEVFPQLRRVECRVDYTVRAFSMDEGKEILMIRPQQLSLEEMFLIANTYEKGSTDFNNVFEIAVQMFPEDKVANFNAAATALSKGNIERANTYLKVCDFTTPDMFNNFGVLYLMQGNFERAEEFLNKARDNGVKEAEYNLLELKKKLADNDLFNAFKK